MCRMGKNPFRTAKSNDSTTVDQVKVEHIFVENKIQMLFLSHYFSIGRSIKDPQQVVILPIAVYVSLPFRP